MKGLQTPSDLDKIAPVPTGAPSGSVATGGVDLGPDGKKETPNSVSGLPAQATTYLPGPGAPAPGAQVPMPDTSKFVATFETETDKIG